MLSSREKRTVYEKAFVPEHLVEYVTAVSGAEPFLVGDYLFYHSNEHLNLIGYPLSGKFSIENLEKALDKALDKFKPSTVSIIAQQLPAIEKEAVIDRSSDSYYFLDLGSLRKGRKLRNLLKRAARDNVVKKETYGSEHSTLVRTFLTQRSLDEASRYVFEKIPEYLSKSRSALLFAARTSNGKLSAFNIFDYGSRGCAFYMFSFYSKKRYVPGASDLILDEALNPAVEQGKVRVNMGLGVSPGIRGFKKKWGALPELKHEFILYNQELLRLLSLSRSLGV